MTALSLVQARGSADEARSDFAVLRQWGVRSGFGDVVKAVLNIWRSRGWVALGYSSWADAFAGEVGEPLRMSTKNRRKLVAELSAAGMSSRAIAVVTGTGDRQAAGDIQTAQKVHSLDIATDPAIPAGSVAGLDGAVRVTDRHRSAALTAKIAELRESSLGLTWPQIGELVGLSGNAAHMRYRHHQSSARAKVESPPAPPARTHETRQGRVQRIVELVAEGATSDLIASQIGVRPEYVRLLAREEGIELTADIQRGGMKVKKSIDEVAATDRWLDNLDAALASSTAFLNPEHADPAHAEQWAARLRDITKHLQALTRKYDRQSKKEETHP